MTNERYSPKPAKETYQEHMRFYSYGARTKTREELNSFYRLIDEHRQHCRETPDGGWCYLEKFLLDHLERQRVMSCDPPSLNVLVKTLEKVLDRRKVNFGLVLCPDWSWIEENGRVRYTMVGLNDGIPKTAEVVLPYLRELAKRGTKSEIETRVITYIAGYEIQDKRLRGEISLDEAKKRLETTAQKTQLGIEGVGIRNSHVSVYDPEEFGAQVREKTRWLLDERPERVESSRRARQGGGAYGDKLTPELAAEELAQAAVIWQDLIDTGVDIIIVPTSPIIAELGLREVRPRPENQIGRRGHPPARIQLPHGYIG